MDTAGSDEGGHADWLNDAVDLVVVVTVMGGGLAWPMLLVVILIWFIWI